MGCKSHLLTGIILQLIIGLAVVIVSVYWVRANGYSILFLAIPLIAVPILVGWVWKRIPARCPFRGCGGASYQHRDKKETDGRRGYHYTCDECGKTFYTIWAADEEGDQDEYLGE